MLYTLITFVALFVIATTAAVIYYVKAEDFRTQAAERQEELNRLVSQEENRNIAGIVGTRLPGHSSLGTVIEHLDEMVRVVKGTPVRVTSAEVKVAETKQALLPLFERARAHVTLPVAPPTPVNPDAAEADPDQPADPNAAALPRIVLTTLISDLVAELGKVKQEKAAKEQELNSLKGRFDDAIAVMEQTKKDLTAKVSEYEQQVKAIETDYLARRGEVEQSSKEQLGVLQGDLQKAVANARQLNDDLLRTQAEYNVVQGRLQQAVTQISDIRPAPDKEARAFTSDGRIVLVDQAANVVHIDLGTDDRVYQGLTFSVYDRTAGIPRDGKPKAQVEIFAIDPKVSAARVLSWDRKNPIATGDLVANLIWDRDKQNEFVVTGDFDLDGDKRPDYDAATRIEALIRRWGGVVSQKVTGETDYMILGAEPKVPPQPTAEMQTADPTALERYEAARQRNEQYHQLRERAEALCVPIYSFDRFLFFTGYAAQASRPGAL